MAATRIIKFSFVAILATLSAMSLASRSNPEKSGDLEAGRKIYMSNCEVCHLIGRNLVNPAKEIQNSKMMDDPKRLKEFLSHKNGKMPPFSEISKSDTAIRNLREFLLYAKKNPSEVDKPNDSAADTSSVTKSGKN